MERVIGGSGDWWRDIEGGRDVCDTGRIEWFIFNSLTIFLVLQAFIVSTSERASAQYSSLTLIPPDVRPTSLASASSAVDDVRLSKRNDIYSRIVE